MYHDVPRHLLSNFEAHIRWLLPRFEFLSPNDLVGRVPTGRLPKALLTFDDGCVDNYDLVAPLLESHGLRGLFFVCPGFADLSREASFQLMERASILFGEKSRDSRWQRMSQEQIVDLDKRGHGIGSHTLTHLPLARINEVEARKEIAQSATHLISWLGHPCDYFAWTYSWDQISCQALAAAFDNHAFCFSPCSGLNEWPVRDNLLWRTGIDVSKPVSHLQTQISGLVDYSYGAEREQLGNLGNLGTDGTYPGFQARRRR